MTARTAQSVDRWAHLRALTDAGGLYEHALLTRPRPEHGYCVDDVARGLVVLCRADAAPDLRAQYLAFVLAAQVPDGTFHNRRDLTGRWTDQPGVEDCWGRALWGLGAAARHGDATALTAFARGARHRTPHARARQLAALGAAEVLAGQDHGPARALLQRAVEPLLAPSVWWWPEPRLTYANAVVPEVLLAGGELLGRADLLDRGLALLDRLLAAQTASGHLSVVPVGGAGPGETLTGRFDQQPIEVQALADALARAWRLTGDDRWARGLQAALAWFHGENDLGVPLVDPASGGSCDGLHPDRRNENQGAESTLAWLATLTAAGRW